MGIVLKIEAQTYLDFFTLRRDGMAYLSWAE